MKSIKLLKILGIVTPVIVFAMFSIFGLSVFTGNNIHSGLGISKASTQEPADINSDGKVDIFDLSTLLSNWNKTGTNASDINNDSVVNIFDLSSLLSKWGSVAVVTPTPSITLSAQDLTNINTKRILFGHQSVGGNILDAMPSVYTSYGVSQPIRAGEWNMASIQGPFFGDFGVGANGDPMGKIDDFNNTIRDGMGAKLDVAFFKFCYVDMYENTAYQTIFDHYKTIMDALARDYPNVKFIYVTQPLTSTDATHNTTREKYNALIRQTYGATGRVFDLARIESTTPTGDRVSGVYNNQTYYSLYSGYTSDGGHLNSAGGQAAAKEMLTVIANLIR